MIQRLRAPEGLTDKNTVHSYLPFYELLFAGMQDVVKSVVEIGVDGGGSLIMWEEFFYDANIMGIDIMPRPPAIEGHPRIFHQQCDAYSPDTRFDVHDKLDIIIDDGSHFIEDQIKFLHKYASAVEEKGLLIIEDVQDMAHIRLFKEALPEGFYSFCSDMRANKGRYDDVIFVAKKL